MDYPVPEKNYILRSELDKYLKAGYLGPFKVEVAGATREYIFNPRELSVVIRKKGRCPCKPVDPCLCPTFIKYGVCVCKMWIEVVDSDEEYIMNVRKAREYWRGVGRGEEGGR